MYFAPALRGKGIAQILIQQCLTFAQEVGFKACYLETLPFYESGTKVVFESRFSIYFFSSREYGSWEL